MAKIGNRSVRISRVTFLIYLERTHKQVKEHYMNYLRPSIKKDDWSLEEDLKLV